MSRFERITGIPAPTRLELRQAVWGMVIVIVGGLTAGAFLVFLISAVLNAFGIKAPITEPNRIEAKLDQIIDMHEQTNDFLSDLHAEKERAR